MTDIRTKPTTSTRFEFFPDDLVSTLDSLNRVDKVSRWRLNAAVLKLMGGFFTTEEYVSQVWLDLEEKA